MRIEELLSDRLAKLISESENPMAEMQMVSSMLLHADMADYLPSPSTSPQEFADAVIAENWTLREHLATHRIILTDLEGFETAEQLINSLLPASSE